MSEDIVITFINKFGQEIAGRVVSETDDEFQVQILLYARKGDPRNNFKPQIKEYFGSPYYQWIKKKEVVCNVPSFNFACSEGRSDIDFVYARCIKDDVTGYFDEGQYLENAVLYTGKFFIPETNEVVTKILREHKPRGWKQCKNGHTIPMYPLSLVKKARDFIPGGLVPSNAEFPTWVREIIFDPLISKEKSIHPPSQVNAAGKPTRVKAESGALWAHFYRDFAMDGPIDKQRLEDHYNKMSADPACFGKIMRDGKPIKRPWIMFKSGVRPRFIAQLVQDVFSYARRPDCIPEFLVYYVHAIIPAYIDDDQEDIAEHIGRVKERAKNEPESDYEKDGFVVSDDEVEMASPSSADRRIAAAAAKRRDQLKKQSEVSDPEDETFDEEDEDDDEGEEEQETEEEGRESSSEESAVSTPPRKKHREEKPKKRLVKESDST